MPTLFSRKGLKGLKWLGGLELPQPYGEELRGLLRLLSALRKEKEEAVARRMG
jgi:hypothetical protein